MSVKVNEVEIEDSAVQAEIERLRVDYERYVRENGGEPDEQQLHEWALENLIEKELLTQEALRSQAEPGAAQVASYLKDNSDSFDTELSDEEKRELCVRDIKIRALVKSVRKGVKPPPEEELLREYNEHIERFTVPESLRVSHISRLPRAAESKSQAYLELLDIRQKIENFELTWMEALPRSDTYAEDMGVFDTVIRGLFPSEVEEQLFALNRGQVSDVIELEHTNTLHIFRILVKRNAEVIPFEDVREDIRSMLFNDAAENALNGLVDQLKTSADIKR